MVLTHQADRSGKLLTFLRRELGLSSSLVKRLKWQNAFLVGGEPVHTDFMVFPGNLITVILDEAEPEFPPEDGPLDILYEDESLLAVDKPAGMLIHPSRSKNVGTLANFVLGYYQNSGQDSAFHPVTRLDRDTFGVVLLAKNPHIHALMMGKLREGAIKKTYYALVWGTPEAEGVINAPIARREKPSLLRYVDESGKPCLTTYKLLKIREKCSLLELHPITGRTHQLRVHCAHIGHPILGDPQYGSEVSQQLSREMGIATQALCAGRLEFTHPVTGKEICLQIPNDIFLVSPFGDML